MKVAPQSIKTLDVRLQKRINVHGDVPASNPALGRCWQYIGKLNNRGYGPHRSVYEYLVGKVPAGLTLDHLCRNRACVNPNHLEPVTQFENSKRGKNVPSAINAMKTHCPLGHPLSGNNLYIRPDRYGRMCRKCKAIRERIYYYNHRDEIRGRMSRKLGAK